MLDEEVERLALQLFFLCLTLDPAPFGQTALPEDVPTMAPLGRTGMTEHVGDKALPAAVSTETH